MLGRFWFNGRANREKARDSAGLREGGREGTEGESAPGWAGKGENGGERGVYGGGDAWRRPKSG